MFLLVSWVIEDDSDKLSHGWVLSQVPAASLPQRSRENNWKEAKPVFDGLVTPVDVLSECNPLSNYRKLGINYNFIRCMLESWKVF